MNDNQLTFDLPEIDLRFKIRETIKYHEPIPNHTELGNYCRRNHGLNGQTIRYKKSRQCIKCVRTAIAQHKVDSAYLQFMKSLQSYSQAKELKDEEEKYDY